MRFKISKVLIVTIILLVIGMFSNIALAQRGGRSNPTPEPDYSYLDIFPIGLACSSAEAGIGATWNEVTIGVSTLEDFEERFGEVQPRYDMFVVDSEITYIGKICVKDGVITAIQVGSHLPYLSDFVATYGIPDAVTYGHSPFSRIAFWFEEGIAADIYINPISPTYYQIVNFVIYFPYQEVEGFEERYPYAYTLEEGIPDRDINVSDEQNPFNFDDIAATITAQPPRTPLPTRTPMPTSTPHQ